MAGSKLTATVTRADLAAGWEIEAINLSDARSITWVTDPAELAPHIENLRSRGYLVASVLPVAALREAQNG